MPERHGKNSQVILDGVVIKCNSMDIDRTKDTVEVTGFGDTQKRFVLGHANWAAALAGHWNDSNDKLWDIADADAAVYGYFYPDVVNAPSQYSWGEVLVDASMSSSVTTSVTFTANALAFGTIIRSGLP